MNRLKMMKYLQNDAESDTTGDDSSTVADFTKTNFKAINY